LSVTSSKRIKWGQKGWFELNQSITNQAIHLANCAKQHKSNKNKTT